MFAVTSFFVAHTVFAFPGVVDPNAMAETAAKIVNTVGDTGVAISNSFTGGNTSKHGAVKAEGTVAGSATVAAEGKNSTAKARVGSSSGVTADGDITTKGYVGKDVNVRATSENSNAELSVGSAGR